MACPNCGSNNYEGYDFPHYKCNDCQELFHMQEEITVCPQCGMEDCFVEDENGLKCTNCGWEDENPEIEEDEVDEDWWDEGNEGPDEDTVFDGDVEETL